MTDQYCRSVDCDAHAAFFVFAVDQAQWRPICERHARQLHPSLEVHAWLESGYMKPVELGQPPSPPSTPTDARETAFRSIVEDAMGWSEGSDSE